MNGPSLPMPLIGYGGYLETQGITNVVPLGDASLLDSLAYPERISADNPDENYMGHPSVPAAIAAAQTRRLQRQLGSTRLPRATRSLNQLMLARLGQDDLRRVSESLPKTFADDQHQRQVQVSFAAYQAGLSVGVSLAVGGFDTHGNHDADHLQAMQNLLNAATFVIDESERLGIADKVALVIGSDFGRTPGYNDGNGKDHWPLTSMMFKMPGVTGGRVIGATSDRQGPLLIDPATLAVTGAPESAPGIQLSIDHIHRSLRRYAQISDEFQANFPLGGEDLGLFV
ncbi:MAG: DUF1501 domain-containing protein [Polyangiales bacterium]